MLLLINMRVFFGEWNGNGMRRSVWSSDSVIFHFCLFKRHLGTTFLRLYSKVMKIKSLKWIQQGCVVPGTVLGVRRKWVSKPDNPFPHGAYVLMEGRGMTNKYNSYMYVKGSCVLEKNKDGWKGSFGGGVSVLNRLVTGFRPRAYIQCSRGHGLVFNIM